MPLDGHIRLLSVHVANKIAAGEVVDRPASVVKELMENALDAGATRLTVNVTAGGRKLIEVDDDGHGMGRDDALMSIERQATSKISDVDDIERIDSYGFRGEALPSIAAVSRFTLRTCRQGETVGTELVVLGGRLQDVRDVGLPSGTSVAVRDLFFNVPARRKFLRTYQTEQAHLRTTFILQALAHPEVGMLLKADGREVHRLPAGATREERVRDLFGADLLAELRPVSLTRNGVRVEGFVSLPSLTRADRSEQYLFVNRRAVSAGILAYALREAYPPLEGDRKPVVLLFVELDPTMVDVNVHPTKREVRFRRPADVREAVIAAVAEALGPVARARAADTVAPPAALPATPPGAMPTPAGLPPRENPARNLPGAMVWPPAAGPMAWPSRPTDADHTATGATPANDLPAASAAVVPAEPAPVGDGPSPWKWFRILGPVANRYVLLETDGGFVVLDPRAAHERILYERLLAGQRGGHVVSQRLLLPETVQLPPEDAQRLRQHLAVIQTLGFSVDDFGHDRFIVEALPLEVAGTACRELLADIAHDLEQAGVRRGSEHRREETVARAACRAAVRNEGMLAPAALERLVADLARTQMPYTCPRGRPTIIFTSLRELARKFGRE